MKPTQNEIESAVMVLMIWVAIALVVAALNLVCAIGRAVSEILSS